MFIVECLPLKTSSYRDSLSYFSAKSISAGALVNIPIRGKIKPAIALRSTPIEESKSEIKSATFSMRKISSVAATSFVDEDFMRGVHEAAFYFATTSSSILLHIIPAFITNNPKLLQYIKNKSKIEKPISQTKSRLEIIQTEFEERYMHYKAAIREEFAKKKSVFLCLPQNEDVRKAKNKLEKGIESFVVYFHNEMSDKEITTLWKKTITSEHPLLIIATANWFFIPRQDIGLIILDQENKSGWKTLKRPFVDLRKCLEIIGRSKNVRTVLGDSILRVETLFRYKQGEIEEFESVKWRLPSQIQTDIIDMGAEAKKNKIFSCLSKSALIHLKKTSAEGNHSFVYAARKGLAPSTLCQDCGSIVVCSNCEAPMILYKKRDTNVFRCHQCGEVREAAETCKTCGGWRLASFGTGIEKVVDELKEHFDKSLIFQIDRETTPSSKSAGIVMDKFLQTRGSILVGTEMVISFLNKKVNTSLIAAFDSLFSVPDFRIREKIFRLILEIRSIAKENFIVQSRNIDNEALLFAKNGNLIEFYKMESEERAALSYPPYSIFIKITSRGSKSHVNANAIELEKIFGQFNPLIFPSIHEKRGEVAAINLVLKIKEPDWPQIDLVKTLKSLPQHYEIKVDPDNLL